MAAGRLHPSLHPSLLSNPGHAINQSNTTTQDRRQASFDILSDAMPYTFSTPPVPVALDQGLDLNGRRFPMSPSWGLGRVINQACLAETKTDHAATPGRQEDPVDILLAEEMSDIFHGGRRAGYTG